MAEVMNGYVRRSCDRVKGAREGGRVVAGGTHNADVQ